MNGNFPIFGFGKGYETSKKKDKNRENFEKRNNPCNSFASK